MNSKKLGMIAAAALSLVAVQGFAGEAHATKGDVCVNGCKNAKTDCGGKAFISDIKDKDACTKHGGKWGAKPTDAKDIKTSDLAKK